MTGPLATWSSLVSVSESVSLAGGVTPFPLLLRRESGESECCRVSVSVNEH